MMPTDVLGTVTSASPISEEVGKFLCKMHQPKGLAALKAKPLMVPHPWACFQLPSVFSEQLHSCFPRNSTLRLCLLLRAAPGDQQTTPPHLPSIALSWLLVTLHSSFFQQEIWSLFPELTALWNFFFPGCTEYTCVLLFTLPILFPSTSQRAHSHLVPGYAWLVFLRRLSLPTASKIAFFCTITLHSLNLLHFFFKATDFYI